MTSRLVGTSSSTRTLDQRDLAALRPAKENAPRPRKPRRPPMARSLTFFCSNPQCNHATWSPDEQARHMAQEYWTLTKAVVRLAPDSPEALALTGGVILSELTDEECRAGANAYNRLRNEGHLDDIPADIRLVNGEYSRRQSRGLLEENLTGWRKGQLVEFCVRGHEMSGENVHIRPSGQRACRACGNLHNREWREKNAEEYRKKHAEAERLRRQRPEVRARYNEYDRNRERKPLTPEQKERKNAARREARARKKAESGQRA